MYLYIHTIVSSKFFQRKHFQKVEPCPGKIPGQMKFSKASQSVIRNKCAARSGKSALSPIKKQNKIA